MKKSVWISMIVAGACLLVGLCCIAVGHALGGHKLLTEGMSYEGKIINSIYHETSDFDRIRIDVLSADVELIPSEDEQCRIIIEDGEGIEYTVRVVEDTLTIRATDTRSWYEKLFVGFMNGNSLKIALPREEYKSLSVHTTSGTININVRYTFSEDVTLTSVSGTVGTAATVSGHLELRATSGNIYVKGNMKTVTAHCTSGKISIGGKTVIGDCTATDVKLDTTSGSVIVRKATLNNLTTETASGDISLDSLSVMGNIDVSATSGDITLLYVTCGSFAAETASGAVELIDTTTKGNVRVQTTSGSIRFTRADADTLNLKTTSGSVKGTLRTPKIFYTDTTSGSVDVPKSAEGGLCEIKTTSGDIRITYSE
jgi:lia operon protein LiaG